MAVYVHPFRWTSLLRMDRARMNHEDSLAHDIGQGLRDEMVG